MSYKIGPRELFVPKSPERDNIIKQDSESAITWYKSNYLDAPDARQRVIKKCGNGLESIKNYQNFLFCSAHNKNVTLVKFIVDHIDDKSTLNLLDSTFIQTAVTYAVMIRAKKTNTPTSKYQTICDNSYACTKILLDGGASPNVFFAYTGLMEGRCSEKNLIPTMAASVLINWTAMIKENKKDLGDNDYKQNCLTYTHYLEKIFLLFFQHGASIALCEYNTLYNAQNNEKFTIRGRQIHAQSEVVESDTPYLKEIVPKCVDLIKHTQVNACWERYRLFFLASKSPASLIATIPKDINSLIANCLFDL